MKNYFIYDGRAYCDIESAMVLERFEAPNNQAAAKYHARKYKGIDSVLCDSEDNIIY